MNIDRLDHLVLTVNDIATTCAFYTRVLGMVEVTFALGRTGLAFGNQKINLHRVGRQYEPVATHPTPGSADLCFITYASVEQVLEHLRESGVAVVKGPVPRIGAAGGLNSVYIHDPDQNLIEISVVTP